jgi:hypothetical protein
MMHLWCAFYVSRPIFGEAQLDELQRVIEEILPHWSSGMSVAKDEDSKDRIAVGHDDRLHDCLHRVAPPKRGLGSAVLFGAQRDLAFYLQHSEPALPPESNEIAIEIYRLPTVENQTASAWAREAFEAIAARLPIRYANAYADEEYYAKNMIDDETGVRAIGAKITRATPGLYWLNFFGRPYVDLIGNERLLSAPACEVKSVDDGVLIALDSSADAWTTAAYQQREQAVIEHLGRQYFFSRHDPARQTVAPDFRAYLKRQNDA